MTPSIANNIIMNLLQPKLASLLGHIGVAKMLIPLIVLAI
jgi:hypothetical protein